MTTAAGDAGVAREGGAGVPVSPVEVVRSAQHLRVGTEWVRSGRVLVRRRIETTRRTVEVEVRREVLELAGDDVDFRDGRLVGTSVDGEVVERHDLAEPVVVVLREEVPEIVVRVVPYERVVVSTTVVDGDVDIVARLRHEEVDVSDAERPTG